MARVYFLAADGVTLCSFTDHEINPTVEQMHHAIGIVEALCILKRCQPLFSIYGRRH